MDETAFRQKLSRMIERPCTFEKAILTGRVKCSNSKRIQIAERDAVTCLTQYSLYRCTTLHDHLRESFSFALKVNLADGLVLSHSQELRVQCGGLIGLQQVLNGLTDVDSVDGLLETAILKWGDWADIPYSEVIQAAIFIYKGR